MYLHCDLFSFYLMAISEIGNKNATHGKELLGDFIQL